MKTLVAVLVIGSPLVMANEREDALKRLNESVDVFSEIMRTPDRGIPQDLLDKAHCVVIVPGVKKGAFIIGGTFGRGYMSCRDARGWSGPAAVRMEGGSFGFQIGGEETDVVLLVMNDRGAEKLLGSQFTLGGEGEIAAGPVGRSATAQTDASMHAEILSWSRARGVFAGIALKGATLREDKKTDEALYGREVSNRSIVHEHIASPESADMLRATLHQYSPRERS